jgi:Ornithine cyclodeaminase/mu-crystallin family
LSRPPRRACPRSNRWVWTRFKLALTLCASGADLYHAVRAGTVTREGIHADFAELASGQKARRKAPEELVIFDSSGSGVHDEAVAWVAYQVCAHLADWPTLNLSGRPAL